MRRETKSDCYELEAQLIEDEIGEAEPFLPDLGGNSGRRPPAFLCQGLYPKPLLDPLPPRDWCLRFARCTIFSVYRRMFLLVLIANAFYGYQIFTMKRRSKYSPLLVDISTAASANMLVAVLVRQDYIINALFRISWLVPFWLPLRIRRSIAKIYEYGGLHSGAAVASVLWFSILSGILTWEFITIRIADPLIMICTFIILCVLWAMLITSYPQYRSWKHNTFENIHRFGGWIALGLFWPQLYLFTRALGHQAGPRSPGAVLTELPAFYLLILSCFHVGLPWMRLRRLPVQPERLGVGVHAIRLHHNESVANCVVYRIADRPLQEWHSFACIPQPGGTGGSLIISNAGDWTRRAINNPKKSYYTRGIPIVGVLCMSQIFRRVIIVTTGSGIGPCLGTILNVPTTKFRLIWSAPEPRHTFGDDIYDKVISLDARAVIIDTREVGRKDLISLAHNMLLDEGAEAIFCVSNRALTKSLVYEMESRGVPAFGPIWDS